MQRVVRSAPSARHVDRAPSPTWDDLKRLGWVLALVELMIAGLAWLTREYFGPRTALWVGVGLGSLVLVGFALVVLFSVVASYVDDWSARGSERAAPGSRPSALGHGGSEGIRD